MHLLKIITTVIALLLAYASYKLDYRLATLLGCFSFTAIMPLVDSMLCSSRSDSRFAVYRFILLFAGAAFSAFVLYSLYLACLYSLASSSSLILTGLSQRLICLIAAVVLYFYSVFSLRVAENEQDIQLASIFAAASKISGFTAVLFFIYVAAFYLSPPQSGYAVLSVDYLLVTANFYIATVNLELLFVLFAKMIAIIKKEPLKTVLPLFTIASVSSEATLKKSFVSAVEEKFGIDLSKSEMASYFAAIFEPAIICALIFFWISTSIVIVPVDKEAVVKTFGVTADKKSALPGVHFKLPWPLATVVFNDSKKIKTIDVGFEAGERQNHLIWAKQHSLTNVNLIVGDGVELINIDCRIYYRINNLVNYLNEMANPDDFIQSAAYKLLTLATVSSTFDDIISQDRALLANKIKEELQRNIDAYKAGIEIVEVVFLAIHPPLEVAGAFEDIISAQIDKPAYVLKAKTEREHKLHFHRADAFSVEMKAKMGAQDSIQRAAGEAYSIIGRSIPFNSEPELESFRLKLESMQRIYKTKNLYIFDKALMREKDSIILNLPDQ